MARHRLASPQREPRWDEKLGRFCTLFSPLLYCSRVRATLCARIAELARRFPFASRLADVASRQAQFADPKAGLPMSRRLRREGPCRPRHIWLGSRCRRSSDGRFTTAPPRRHFSRTSPPTNVSNHFGQRYRFGTCRGTGQAEYQSLVIALAPAIDEEKRDAGPLEVNPSPYVARL